MALITVPTASNTHTSGKCEPGDGLTSLTANIDEEHSTIGVSLENAHLATTPQFFEEDNDDEDEEMPTPTIEEVLADGYVSPEGYDWHFLRVSYGRADKVYKMLKDFKKGYLIWMPCQKHISYKNGMKITKLQPIFPSNLFIFSTFRQAFKLTKRSKKGYPFIDFAFDHTNKNEYGRDNVITIPFYQMVSFARAVEVQHPWAHIVPEEKIHFREGGYVKVTGGSFEGVVGRVARVYGQTRVVISIKGIVNYATAYVSSKYLEPIDKPKDEPRKHAHRSR